MITFEVRRLAAYLRRYHSAGYSSRGFAELPAGFAPLSLARFEPQLKNGSALGFPFDAAFERAWIILSASPLTSCFAVAASIAHTIATSFPHICW